MRENDRLLRTAQYTGGPEENAAKNTGEKGPDRQPTAQNTHNGRLKDALFRVIDDTELSSGWPTTTD